MRELDRVVGIRLKSFKDLVRLSASSITVGQSTFILRIHGAENTIYGVLAVFRDYFKLYGVPLLYYFIDKNSEVPEDANYVLLRTGDDGERIEFSKGSRAGYVTIPIINVAELPEFLQPGTGL